MKKILYFLAFALVFGFSACGEKVTPIDPVPVYVPQHYTVFADELQNGNTEVFYEKLQGLDFSVTAEFQGRNDEDVSIFHAFFIADNTSQLLDKIEFLATDTLVFDSNITDTTYVIALTIQDGTVRKFQKVYHFKDYLFNKASGKAPVLPQLLHPSVGVKKMAHHNGNSLIVRNQPQFEQESEDSKLKDKLSYIGFAISFIVTFLVANFKKSKIIEWIGSTSQRITVVTSILSLIVLVVFTGFSAESMQLLIESLQMIDFTGIFTMIPSGTIAAQGFYDKMLKEQESVQAE